MAIISFMAGGMLAFLTATGAWLFGNADVMMVLKVYLCVSLAVPALILLAVLLRRAVHNAPVAARARA